MLARQTAKEHCLLGLESHLGLSRVTLRTGHISGGTSRRRHGNLAERFSWERTEHILLSFEGQQFVETIGPLRGASPADGPSPSSGSRTARTDSFTKNGTPTRALNPLINEFGFDVVDAGQSSAEHGRPADRSTIRVTQPLMMAVGA